MLNKKSIKILSIVLLVVILLVTIGSSVFATTTIPETPFNNDKASDLVGVVLGALKWGAIMIAAGMLIYMGIKYMTSAPDGKAEMKKQLTIYIVGFILAVAAAAIVGVLETTIKSAAGETTASVNTSTVIVASVE